MPSKRHEGERNADYSTSTKFDDLSGVVQLGQHAWLITRRPQVRILPPPPLDKMK